MRGVPVESKISHSRAWIIWRTSNDRGDKETQYGREGSNSGHRRNKLGLEETNQDLCGF